MLDFSPVRQKTITLSELANSLTKGDLRSLTNEMIDTMGQLIGACVDADVVMVPEDPNAHDPDAATEGEIGLSWTLGHVIVHTTASSEESAFLAAELARGVPHREGRSRNEIPWTAITTIAQCRQRLEESRRMRLASLEIWPDEPDLDNTYSRAPSGPPSNAITRFIFGLMHDDSHLGQISNIVDQAGVARVS
jgi:hypothetical protein